MKTVSRHFILAGSALALALAGAAVAETITSKSGNSTSTVTQEGGGPVRQKVTKTPDGQTIVTESGGNTSSVTQKTTPGDAKDCAASSDASPKDKDGAGQNGAGKDKTAAAGEDVCRPISEPKDFGPGFERAQALKDRMDAMRRQ